MGKHLCIIPLLLAMVAGGVIRAAGVVDRDRADLAEYLERRSKVRAGDAAGYLEVARWCRIRELWSPMAEMAREAMAIDSSSQAAYAMLREYDEKATLPAEEEAARALEAELERRIGHNFKTRQTRHFLVAYDTTDRFVAQQAGSLEKTYEAFWTSFNMKTLRPIFLEQRLVVVLFRNRADFRKYATAVDGQVSEWAAGYYAQGSNRSVFYDDRTDRDVVAIEDQVDDLRTKLKEYETKISKAKAAGQTGLANALTTERNALNERILKIDATINSAISQVNTLKVVHEACHQLAFNTGVQKRLVDYPAWVCEGLACAFETADRQGNRGPGVINRIRMDVVKEALAKGRFMSLEKLVAINPDTLEEKQVATFYAESWGLFHWLYKTHRAELEQYLMSYQIQRSGRLSDAAHQKLFTSAFGEDMGLLERRWKDYLREAAARER